MGLRSRAVALSVAIGTITAACSGPEPDFEGPVDRTPEVAEGFVEAGDGVRLFYRRVGSADDTMVVVHGGPGMNMEYFAADLQPLADEITLVFYDPAPGCLTRFGNIEHATG